MRAELNTIAAAFDKLPTLSGKANRIVQVNASETGLEAVNSITLSALALTAGAIVPVLFTPTLFNTLNVDSSAANAFQGFAVGGVVNFSGSFTVNATAANTLTEVDFSLPIASALTSNVQLRGTAVRTSTSAQYISGVVFANTTDDRATLRYYNDSDVGSQVWTVVVTYRVVA